MQENKVVITDASCFILLDKIDALSVLNSLDILAIAFTRKLLLLQRLPLSMEKDYLTGLR